MGLHLAWPFSIAATAGFITALILMTGEVEALWPLYVIPIVLAALAYHAPGAILVSALVAALLVVLAYGAGLEPGSPAPVIVGLVSFALSGLVIGLSAAYEARQTHVDGPPAHDDLTGTFSPERLDEILAAEVRRCERYSTQCSYLILEVSGFDEFVRTFGQLKGGLLLQRFADVVTLAARETDSIGRCTEHSFGIVAPETDASAAASLGERIVAAIASTQFEGDALEPVVHSSARLGIATYPADRTSAKELVACANERLETTEPAA